MQDDSYSLCLLKCVCGHQSRRHTEHDAGCYVDAARGIYGVDRIVEIAKEHGMPEPKPCQCEGHGESAGTVFATNWGACDYSNEVEDVANTYMNDHFPVDGHYWGRAETGDWGLWLTEED